MKRYLTKPVLAWAFYDWANSAFAVIVLTAFYPVLFQSFWSVDTDAVTTTARIGTANAISSIVIVLLAPILGAIADASKAKKRFLILFSFVGIIMTACLYFIAEGEWLFASIAFIFSVIGFSGANIFYDSLLMDVSKTDQLDNVSALGYSLGYLGGGLLFLLTVFMSLYPTDFGFSNDIEAQRFSFLLVALWWFVFSLPIIFFVDETKNTNSKKNISVIAGLQQIKRTAKEIKSLRVVFLFLIAYWFYIDGVDTIVRMAIPYGLSVGLEASDLIKAILITQFVGFPAAIVFGYWGRKLGAKKVILFAIFGYLIITLLASQMNTSDEFYILALSIGCVQGGVQSLSRSFYARIIPVSKSAEFFGFYNMLGKFAAVVGPLIMSVIAVVTNDTRASILSVAVLFIIGGVLLYFVDEKKGIKMARALEY